jgi:hypothetical protein
MKQSMKNKLITWFDTSALKTAILFLLLFIPLYPKLPLANVPHTWVYIRLEDIAIAITYFIWFILFLRKKVSFKSPLTIPIGIYWLMGFLSLVFTLIFTAPHLANFFPNVAVFHFIRRIEYFGLFIIAFSSIKSKRDLIHYLGMVIIALIGVIFYGFGQKFLGFPAFLTMNEEFAKGVPLYLSPTSRLTSTFAGHYDLAAYLVFLIAFLTSIVWGIRNIFLKLFLLLITVSSLILLLFTASRISFGVYILAVSLSLWLSKKRLLIPFVIIGSIFLMLGVSTMSERFAKTVRVRQVVYDVESGKAIGTLEQAPEGSVETNQKVYVPITTETKESLPVGSSFTNLPSNLKDQEATNIATIKKPVLQSLKMSTVSAEIASISGSFLIKKALVYDISLTTRIQGEWPRAIDAFKRNIIFGSGYSSIGLSNDNDYLRSLAETGLLGFGSFMLMLLSIIFFLKNSLITQKDSLIKAAGIGLLAGVLGIMINAVFIDVFEASKVAYPLWMISGIIIGAVALNYKNEINYRQEFLLIAKSIFAFLQTNIVALVGLGVMVFSVLLSIKSIYFVGDDFTWLRWAAEVKGPNDIMSFFTQANGFFYRPLAKLLYFGMYNVFWLEPGGYHILSLVIHIVNSFLVYLIGKKLLGSKTISYICAILFSVLSIHGESLFWTAASFEMLGPLFGLLAFYLYIHNKKLVSMIFIFPALLSHESMIVLPLILIAYDFLMLKKINLKAFAISLLITAFYIYLRIASGAHWFNGDYSYNLFRLPFNALGNGVSYLVGILFGPVMLNFFGNVRIGMRQNILFMVLMGICLMGIFVLLIKLRKYLTTLGIFLGISFLISLAPFLGLGNTTERYAYFPSVWLIINVGALFVYIKTRWSKQIAILIIGISTAVLCIWNISELKKSEKDWEKAGDITFTTLASIRNNYINVPPKSTFFVVNLPIKYGNAWVFPVGFDDAMWHSLGKLTPKVQKVNTLDEALEIQKGIKNSYVLIFDNFEIKEVK